MRAGLREAFVYFVFDMHSGLRAMELYSASTRASHQALDRLPYQQVLAYVERLLRGEMTAVIAATGIQIALETSNRFFAMSPDD